MENEYLAKVEKKKTIKQHTDDLLRQYEIIREIKPNILSISEWELLKYAVKYHDLGKINTKFQNKIYDKLKYPLPLLADKRKGKEIYHNFLSPLFVDKEFFLQKCGKEDTKILISAIYYHHHREERDYNLSEIREDLEKQLKGFGNFYGMNLKILQSYPNRYVLIPNCIENIQLMESRSYIMIKGLLNRLDHIASLDREDVNIEEKETGKGISTKVIEQIEESYDGNYRPVQAYMKEKKEENLIVVSPTGSGKTEASLLWIDNQKAFYTLPLKVSINAIYHRIQKEIGYEKVSLLHSDAFSYYLQQEQEKAEMLYERSRKLTSPLIITTVDQIFKIAFKYIGYEEILCTMAYSKIIIDEIQMYSPEMLAYILLGLKMITKVGGKFAIVTATFPELLYHFFDRLEIPYLRQKQEEYFPSHIEIRHKIELKENAEIDMEKIKEKAKTKKVLVIVNTVKKAQEIYEKLKGEKVYLLHSKYMKKDRKQLEESILAFAKKQKENGIWISTQIVEASLDIDFDVLFTEMCSIDSLLQRMGRVYRKRVYQEQDPNVYIYDSKNGIHGRIPIIDPEIYEYTLESVLKRNNKPLSETSKQEMINGIFNPEWNKKILTSHYYTTILKTINLLKTQIPNQEEKSKIDRLFRNIDSISLIPDSIYHQLMSRGKIDEWEGIFKQKGNGKEKAKAKEEISQYTISVTKQYNLVYDVEETFYKGSNIHRTRYQYDFNEELMKGKGLVVEQLKGNADFDW